MNWDRNAADRRDEGPWLQRLRSNWDAVLALFLAWAAIAIVLGPGYYFLFLYLLGCTCIIRMALKR